MHLCIIYEAYYNLAMFPLLDHTTLQTVQTRGHKIKFILPHCSKDVFKYSFLPLWLRGWNALPQSSVGAASMDMFKASLPCVKLTLLMLHRLVFILQNPVPLHFTAHLSSNTLFYQ